MSTSVRGRTTVGDEKVRILPPEMAARPDGPRPVAWIVAFLVAVAALAAVVVVEESRVAGRDDTIATLEREAATALARVEARSHRLGAALATWVPPLTDGSYSGYLVAADTTADPPRIAFEAVESEHGSRLMVLPVSPTADITAWTTAATTATRRTRDLAYLDRMFSAGGAEGTVQRAAWYRIVVEDGTVTGIHQARP